MERLTERNDTGTVFLLHGMFSIGEATQRLAEYEETGLTPAGVFALQIHPDHAYADYVKKMWRENGGMERMEELAKANAEGRLLVLPCKVGDELWFEKNGKIQCETIDRISADQTDEDEDLLISIYTMSVSVLSEDIGRLVFLSREEAENAGGDEGGGVNGD